jgi:type I restriction enzyme M protein
MRRLEVLDAQRNQYAKAKGEKFISIYKNHEECQWSFWKNMNAKDMLKHVSTIVFPFIQNISVGDDAIYSKNMKDATFMIRKPSLLQEAVSIFDELDITNQNQDTQGDIYEHLLSELQISGKNGQFRTPRHIIRMIIELVNPQLGETICDPACGTGGFLINSYEHIVKNNTSEDLIKMDSDGTAHNIIGDKITKKEHWDLLKNKTFYGFDFDNTMLRIGLMNMILHGISHPQILYADSLSKNFDHTKKYDIIIANPPFSGSIDKNDIHDDFKISTSKTELLFLELFYNILKVGGRAGIVIPVGILFGSSKIHVELRKILLEKCQIEAIIYLPSGVFKPYSGVRTAIMIFVKGGSTKNVWLYNMTHDGFSLDDKRERIEQDDIPDILKTFSNKKKTKKSVEISLKQIQENDYSLDVKRYFVISSSSEPLKIQETLNSIFELKNQRKKLEKKMLEDIKKMGFDISDV